MDLVLMNASLFEPWPLMLSTVAATAFALERIIHFRVRGPRSELFAIPLLVASCLAGAYAVLGVEAAFVPRLLLVAASIICGVSSGMYFSAFTRKSER
jgi:hypothetical protein